MRPDGQDSVGSLTNEGDAQMERDAYDAWGKRRNPNGTDDPAGALRSQITPGFTGQEEMDDLGLINYNARLYDPKIGRFLSADTVTERGYASQNYNRYAYARNNPVTFNDPTGHLGDCGESTNGQVHCEIINVPRPPPPQTPAQVAGILKELMRQFPNKTIFRQFVRGGAILGVKGRGGVPTPLQFVPISQPIQATPGVNDGSDDFESCDAMCHVENFRDPNGARDIVGVGKLGDRVMIGTVLGVAAVLTGGSALGLLGTGVVDGAVVGGGAGLGASLGVAAPVAEVAIDSNALFPLLEGGSPETMEALANAISGRVFSIPPKVAEEFLAKGSQEALDNLIASGRAVIGSAPEESTVLNLMRDSGLKRADAEAVASAIRDGLDFLTRDKGIFPRIPIAKKF